MIWRCSLRRGVGFRVRSCRKTENVYNPGNWVYPVTRCKDEGEFLGCEWIDWNEKFREHWKEPEKAEEEKRDAWPYVDRVLTWISGRGWKKERREIARRVKNLLETLTLPAQESKKRDWSRRKVGEKVGNEQDKEGSLEMEPVVEMVWNKFSRIKTFSTFYIFTFFEF